MDDFSPIDIGPDGPGGGSPIPTIPQGSGPWLPTTWTLGGTPHKNVDVPITSVFLFLFMLSAAWHMTIFKTNMNRGHKFLFNAALFGFSMSRIITCTLRIASILTPSNIRLGIAAAIFVAVGVLILFVVNLIWAQRILRAYHPTVGWHRGTKITYITLYTLVGISLLVVIVAVVQNFYTLSKRTRWIDRALQLYGQTFLAIVSSLPLLVVGLALLLPNRKLEKFGAGKMSIKVGVLVTGTLLIAAGAWYRCGTSWATPVQHNRPLPTYFAKPLFYIFNFGVDILTLYMYALMRVDLRFHVPNGAKGPGDYTPKPDWKNDAAATSMQALRPMASIGTNLSLPHLNLVPSEATINFSMPTRVEHGV